MTRCIELKLTVEKLRAEVRELKKKNLDLRRSHIRQEETIKQLGAELSMRRTVMAEK